MQVLEGAAASGASGAAAQLVAQAPAVASAVVRLYTQLAEHTRLPRTSSISRRGDGGSSSGAGTGSSSSAAVAAWLCQFTPQDLSTLIQGLSR